MALIQLVIHRPRVDISFILESDYINLLQHQYPLTTEQVDQLRSAYLRFLQCYLGWVYDDKTIVSYYNNVVDTFGHDQVDSELCQWFISNKDTAELQEERRSLTKYLTQCLITSVSQGKATNLLTNHRNDLFEFIMTFKYEVPGDKAMDKVLEMFVDMIGKEENQIRIISLLTKQFGNTSDTECTRLDYMFELFQRHIKDIEQCVSCIQSLSPQHVSTLLQRLGPSFQKHYDMYETKLINMIGTETVYLVRDIDLCFEGKVKGILSDRLNRMDVSPMTVISKSLSIKESIIMPLIHIHDMHGIDDSKFINSAFSILMTWPSNVNDNGTTNQSNKIDIDNILERYHQEFIRFNRTDKRLIINHATNLIFLSRCCRLDLLSLGDIEGIMSEVRSVDQLKEVHKLIINSFISPMDLMTKLVDKVMANILDNNMQVFNGQPVLVEALMDVVKSTGDAQVVFQLLKYVYCIRVTDSYRLIKRKMLELLPRDNHFTHQHGLFKQFKEDTYAKLFWHRIRLINGKIASMGDHANRSSSLIPTLLIKHIIQHILLDPYLESHNHYLTS
ncbi:hypothetical protein SAMD00019534_098160 [Acytostelium subglobosum LB1]|uniref:hypothetical protein n=1 Tax=Acytostelium subglobosum LB1 TaxID=1410327 RepID=UPI000644ED2D|nr:hypothetical protein SAMD00019534_098160 [Acytostelium subglobosum LB1]GAM26641.1 hypothetical protein SAMD00019534_098160 [Acytostelium subglobosum LB1]|eukprot:XP_012750302.1 hypothetical protein SAMD00019534_098160 [Acytostelium subglobosum LB1]